MHASGSIFFTIIFSLDATEAEALGKCSIISILFSKYTIKYTILLQRKHVKMHIYISITDQVYIHTISCFILLFVLF